MIILTFSKWNRQWEMIEHRGTLDVVKQFVPKTNVWENMV